DGGLRAALRDDRAVERGDDPGGGRGVQAERVPDGEHRLADGEVGGGAERRGREVGGRVDDADDGEVGRLVLADELRGVDPPIGEGDGDLASAVDDVAVGEDVAVGVEDDAGPLALALPGD